MIRLIRKRMEDEKGAASVLVIFMLLILVTLGALAITSANANYKLSQRSLAWNVIYYELDGQGEEFLSALDKKLAEAEMMTLEYMKNKAYQNAEQAGIPTHLQKQILDSSQNNGLDAIAGNIYMYYANAYVKEMTAVYPDILLYSEDGQSFPDTISVDLRVTLKRDVLYGLDISVLVEPMTYTVTEAGGALSLVRADDQVRYKIKSWYEYQDVIHEEQETKLWDGSL